MERQRNPGSIPNTRIPLRSMRATSSEEDAMPAKSQTTPLATRELTITRVFDAPRALVFKMWTEPAHMAQWWGPHGFTNPVCEMDVRAGGRLRIVMRAPDGVEYPMSGTFREI